MPRQFFPLDLYFFEHEKVVGLSDLALRLFLASVAYANRRLTDGYIPRQVVPHLVVIDWQDPQAPTHEQVAKELVEADLWHGAGDRCKSQMCPAGRPGDSFRVHDFLEHNESSDERESERDKERKRKAAWRARKRVEQEEQESPTGTGSGQDGTVPPHRSIREVSEKEDQTHTSADEQPILALQDPPRPDPVQLVYTAWTETLPLGTRRTLTKPRREAIHKALKSYPVEDLIDAVRGWVNDPWEERPQNNDLPLLLHMGSVHKQRNNLETFRDYWRNGRPITADKQTTRAAATAAAMLQGGPDGDGVGGVVRVRRQAQPELPAPADPGRDGPGVVRRSEGSPTRGGVGGDRPGPP